jgi:protein tyrosine phosphatase
MIIEVMSRTQAEKTKFDNDTMVISISNVGQEEPSIQSDNVFLFNFDDEEAPHPNAMKDFEARHLVNIVKAKKNSVSKIVVHCGAGISRSAGVAAALSKWLNNDDSFIFDNPKFCPNRTCYRLVLNQAMGSVDEEELEKVFQHNIDVWRESEEL